MISLLKIILTMIIMIIITIIIKYTSISQLSRHMGTHLRVLNESYPMNINMTGFR